MVKPIVLKNGKLRQGSPVVELDSVDASELTDSDERVPSSKLMARLLDELPSVSAEELSKSQVENASDTDFGLVSGERLAQAVGAFSIRVLTSDYSEEFFNAQDSESPDTVPLLLSLPDGVYLMPYYAVSYQLVVEEVSGATVYQIGQVVPIGPGQYGYQSRAIVYSGGSFINTDDSTIKFVTE